MKTFSTYCQTKLESPVGDLYLVASDAGLCSLSWSKQDAPMLKKLSTKTFAEKHLSHAIKELKEYFKGTRSKFTVQLDAQGTQFQKSVWGALVKIPFGKTNSYKDIAGKVKSEKAFRAVGTANGRNPLPIFIPCHRVIAANGSIGGYSGGLMVKKKLLSLEGVRLG